MRCNPLHEVLLQRKHSSLQRRAMMRVGLLLLGCDAAHAHGYLTMPRPRPPLWAESGMQGNTGVSATYRFTAGPSLPSRSTVR